jgi:hypothetical protein
MSIAHSKGFHNADGRIADVTADDTMGVGGKGQMYERGKGIKRVWGAIEGCSRKDVRM